jgi:rubrerythrin
VSSNPKTPQTLEEFMAQALVMEREAAQRYADLADTMEMHNNRDVAQMFRTMAGYEAKHAEQIMQEMNWVEAPGVPTTVWPSLDAPETVPSDEVHYLMHPYHALELALAAEERAQAFFEQLAQVATSDSVRRAALELRDEEAEHVALVKAWMAKVPKPDEHWAQDPDPPRYSDL